MPEDVPILEAIPTLTKVKYMEAMEYINKVTCPALIKKRTYEIESCDWDELRELAKELDTEVYAIAGGIELTIKKDNYELIMWGVFY